MRELRAAVDKGKPLIAVVEVDEMRGGLSCDQIYEQLCKWDGGAVDVDANMGAKTRSNSFGSITLSGTVLVPPLPPLEFWPSRE